MSQIFPRIGLFLFLVGFGLYNATFFMADFQLTKETVSEKIGNEGLTQLFLQHADGLIGQDRGNQFVLVSDLKRVFAAANQAVLDRYGLSAADVQAVVAASPEGQPFSLAAVDQVFAGEDEVNAFKRKAFRDFGGWLEGSSFASPQDLQAQIANVANSVAEYGVISQFGFDRYRIKDLTFALTQASAVGPVQAQPALFLLLTFGLCIFGALFYILPKRNEGLPGIKNNGIFFSALKNRGWLGILVGTWLIGFYIFLYFYPEYMTTWVSMADPVSYWLKGTPGGRFFLYGFLYTLCVLVMGVRMLLKYRHSRYQQIRTLSVMFFQTAFAFLIPEILLRLNQPYFDFKNIWPLDYDFFFDNELNNLVQSGGLGLFMLFWGILLMLIGVPVFTYFFGKRWYCSWVCGCGGLAETLGDPYRQLSDKSLKAWQIERYLIHSVLVFAVVMTLGVLYTYFTGSGTLFFMNTYTVREVYGAWIGAGFAGVVGTGFYPLMGNRVWCRFGCPLAAYLGLVQRFKSRFRITTNGGQCISCGNCSTHCEMGIDVRSYAQKGQNIVRASCVGCGVCSAVCPRGVLNLENLSTSRE